MDGCVQYIFNSFMKHPSVAQIWTRWMNGEGGGGGGLVRNCKTGIYGRMKDKRSRRRRRITRKKNCDKKRGVRREQDEQKAEKRSNRRRKR